MYKVTGGGWCRVVSTRKVTVLVIPRTVTFVKFLGRYINTRVLLLLFIIKCLVVTLDCGFIMFSSSVGGCCVGGPACGFGDGPENEQAGEATDG